MGFKTQTPMEEMRKRKLMLATPMYGGQCAGMYTRSVAELTAEMAKHKIPLQFHFLFNESLITRARNYCCDEFMRSDCTHMIFIDSDIGFNAADVLAMLSIMDENSPYDIMAAPYPKKCISWEKIKRAVEKGFANQNPNDLAQFEGDYVFNPAPGVTNMPIGEPSEVLEAGTGFMMIRKSALEKFRDAYGIDRMYRPDHVRTAAFDGSREIMMYFQAAIDRVDPSRFYEDTLKKLVEDLQEPQDSVGVHHLQERIRGVLGKVEEERKKDSKRYLSEDYLFCQDARKIGLKVWFCPWMQLKHVGSYIFSGSLGAIAALGVSATADVNMLRPQQAIAGAPTLNPILDQAVAPKPLSALKKTA
jgi:hypothetical protein